MRSGLMRTRIHVLSSLETAMWTQPTELLRGWYREDYLERARADARARGCPHLYIYDPHENLLWTEEMTFRGTAPSE